MFCLGKTYSSKRQRSPLGEPRTHSLSDKTGVMGRPPKDNPRCQQLNLSLTTGELELIRWRADTAGMRLAEYARAALLTTTPPRPAQRAIGSNVDRLFVAQLRRLGGNLNVMLKKLHQTGQAHPPSLDALLGEIRVHLARGFDDDR